MLVIIYELMLNLIIAVFLRRGIINYWELSRNGKIRIIFGKSKLERPISNVFDKGGTYHKVRAGV